MKTVSSMVIATVLFAAASLASALEIVPFSAQALEEAKRSDAPVALHFHSQWCQTCKLQSKAFEAMRSEPGLEMKLLVVDFDADRATRRAFRVPVSGAVVVLRGETERARLIGVVDREELSAALRKAF